MTAVYLMLIASTLIPPLPDFSEPDLSQISTNIYPASHTQYQSREACQEELAAKAIELFGNVDLRTHRFDGLYGRQLRISSDLAHKTIMCVQLRTTQSE